MITLVLHLVGHMTFVGFSLSTLMHGSKRHPNIVRTLSDMYGHVLTYWANMQ